jgi:hypothetical protein
LTGRGLGGRLGNQGGQLTMDGIERLLLLGRLHEGGLPGPRYPIHGLLR